MTGETRITVVMPRVYELPLNLWRWCKLAEVCTVAHRIAAMCGNEFSPTPQELVSRFAGLTRANRIPESLESPENRGRKVKIFRYSVDGWNLCGKDVPVDQPAPPYIPFVLDLEQPYPRTLFVPEGWAIDTLKAIRKGVVVAGEIGGTWIGFTSSGQAIYLDRGQQMQTMLIRRPDILEQYEKRQADLRQRLGID